MVLSLELYLFNGHEQGIIKAIKTVSLFKNGVRNFYSEIMRQNAIQSGIFSTPIPLVLWNKTDPNFRKV